MEGLRVEEGFAESTIDATIHVICHQPADLKEWLDRHPPGDVLERVARSRMAKNKAVPFLSTLPRRSDSVAED